MLYKMEIKVLTYKSMIKSLKFKSKCGCFFRNGKLNIQLFLLEVYGMNSEQQTGSVSVCLRAGSTTTCSGTRANIPA